MSFDSATDSALSTASSPPTPTTPPPTHNYADRVCPHAPRKQKRMSRRSNNKNMSATELEGMEETWLACRDALARAADDEQLIRMEEGGEPPIAPPQPPTPTKPKNSRPRLYARDGTTVWEAPSGPKRLFLRRPPPLLFGRPAHVEKARRTEGGVRRGDRGWDAGFSDSADELGTGSVGLPSAIPAHAPNNRRGKGRSGGGSGTCVDFKKGSCPRRGDLCRRSPAHANGGGSSDGSSSGGAAQAVTAGSVHCARGSNMRCCTTLSCGHPYH